MFKRRPRLPLNENPEHVLMKFLYELFIPGVDDRLLGMNSNLQFCNPRPDASTIKSVQGLGNSYSVPDVLRYGYHTLELPLTTHSSEACSRSGLFPCLVEGID